MPPEAVGMQVCYDSAGLLTLPLDIEGHIARIQSMPDGGISIITIEWKDRECGTIWNMLSRYDKTGTCLYRKELPAGDPEQWTYMDGGFSAVNPKGESLFLNWEGNELPLSDRKALEVVCCHTQKDDETWCRTDGKGRRWLKVESSTLEGYDTEGNLLSRHRLKGEIINTRLDPEGRLIAYTHDYKRNIFRVYRIS